MNCAKVWGYEFVNSVFTKTFRTHELQKHRENILVAREKAMLGDSVLILEKRRRIQKIMFTIEEKKKLVAKLNREIKEHKIELDEEHSSDSKNNQRAFYKPCPKETCTSLLSTRYRCTDENCDTYVCPNCDGIKDGFDDPQHTCNPNDVDSVKLKKRDCKRCPSCQTETYKVDGCDQVWCPPPCGAKEGREGTQWLFSTGNIDNDAPHAPLFYEYMRSTYNGDIPRNAGDCVLRDNHHTIHLVMNYMYDILVDPELTEIHDIQRRCHHIRYHEIVKNNPNPFNHNSFNMNLDLRLQVLENNLPENKWKQTLQRRDKAYNVKKIYVELLELFVSVTDDLFTKFLTKDADKLLTGNALRLHKLQKVTDLLNEMHTLRRYFNEYAIGIRKRFNVAVFIIVKENWEQESYTGTHSEESLL
jgi:hypothetical protein